MILRPLLPRVVFTRWSIHEMRSDHSGRACIICWLGFMFELGVAVADRWDR